MVLTAKDGSSPITKPKIIDIITIGNVFTFKIEVIPIVTEQIPNTFGSSSIRCFGNIFLINPPVNVPIKTAHTFVKTPTGIKSPPSVLL